MAGGQTRTPEPIPITLPEVGTHTHWGAGLVLQRGQLAPGRGGPQPHGGKPAVPPGHGEGGTGPPHQDPGLPLAPAAGTGDPGGTHRTAQLEGGRYRCRCRPASHVAVLCSGKTERASTARLCPSPSPRGGGGGEAQEGLRGAREGGMETTVTPTKHPSPPGTHDQDRVGEIPGGGGSPHPAAPERPLVVVSPLPEPKQGHEWWIAERGLVNATENPGGGDSGPAQCPARPQPSCSPTPPLWGLSPRCGGRGEPSAFPQNQQRYPGSVCVWGGGGVSPAPASRHPARAFSHPQRG